MAALSPLKDIEEKYFECSYCLGNFKEPKLLPCVHRFCRDCLKAIIGKLVENFNCPLCNYLCDIPPGGIDGFRTDFHMKSLLQYTQLQKSATAEETKRCSGCSKDARATSYCFICGGFLCGQCYQIHMTFPMMLEHKPSVLSLADIRDRNLTLERLASLRGSPRCSVHIDKGAEVCCAACGNLPICLVCGHHGRHKGHELHDVTILAEQEREKIQQSLATIVKYTVDVRELPIMVEEAKRKLEENFDKSKEKLRAQHVKVTEKIGRQLREIDDLLEVNKAEIKEVERQELTELEHERENEIVAAVRAINDKYDKLIKERKTKNQNLREDQEGLYGEKRGVVNRGLEIIEKEFTDLAESVDAKLHRNSEELKDIARDVGNRKQRFENFCATVTGILASKNDWSHAQCLPDINAASDPLLDDVRRQYPVLESLTQVTVSDLPSFPGVSVSEPTDSVVNIDGVNDFRGLKIFNMATTDAGSVISTGDVDDEHTHITVTNRHGEVVRQHKEGNIVTVGGHKQYHFRSCSAMSLFKVVTTCRDSEVGIYDTRTDTYVKRNMSDIIGSWEQGHCLICVAADRVNKNIFAGSNSRNVFILDDRLNYSRTLHLPEMIGYPYDISVHNGNLLVCDYEGKRVCIVATEGPEAVLVCELPKPDHEGGDWAPFRVCTDNNGFIYILWQVDVSGQAGKILTQHSQDGCKLLVTKPAPGGAQAITTVMTGGVEKLLLATYEGKFTYRLVMK